MNLSPITMPMRREKEDAIFASRLEVSLRLLPSADAPSSSRICSRLIHPPGHYVHFFRVVCPVDHWRSPTTARRSINDTTISSLHLHHILLANINPALRPIRLQPDPTISAVLTLPAPVHAIRPPSAAFSNNTKLQRRPTFIIPHHAVSTAEPSLSTTAFANTELAQ